MQSCLQRCCGTSARYLSISKGSSRPSPRFSSFHSSSLLSTRLQRRNSTSTIHCRAASIERPFEEETLPGYHADQFLPIEIGETLVNQYKVLGKLGYGANSTVWLCRDIQSVKADDFVALKVYTETSNPQANRELAAYSHLCTVDSKHSGQARIRPLLASFNIQRDDGLYHPCLVHPPLHITMSELQRYGGKASPFPEDIVKQTLQCLLPTLDYLHTEAKMVHCDLKLSNIMLEIEDPSVIPAFIASQATDPVPRKTITTAEGKTRTIYGSRKFRKPSNGADFGLPLLCDFGEARIGSSFPFQDIQPEVYKAPEMLLEIGPLRSAVDIWNLGCMVWDMLQVSHLFDVYDEAGHHNNRVHLGEMVGLLGHPPRDFLLRSEQAWRVFDAQGRWKAQPPISTAKLEDRLTRLSGRSKTEFLAFLRRMLVWKPEERKTARELLEDPWLKEE
ncbi:unnamed protein product [Zymoseptoria tritici ST99CH_1E4]|uniref:non-specific serine/threonine protein kinase n=1 Tax=Zymoseptoria tritici ST99CH_1E4 TaxID=1276532 RepID=A0A2H1FNY0_ZYMTR|nr:unnamed protein product [Zymoseptoria tritici ST99CH_1E4]